MALGVAAVAVLAALIVVAAVFYERPDLDEGWTVEVSGEVDSPEKFNMTGLKELPSVKRSLVLRGTGEDGEPHLYEGVPLHVLLDAAGVCGDADTVRVWAVDNFARSFPLDSIRGRDDVFLAYSMDGAPIPAREDGGVGPVRLIVSQDYAGDEYNAQQCVKYVYKVTVE